MAKSDSPADGTSVREDEAVGGINSSSKAPDVAEGTIDMVAYRNTVPLWLRVWRHSFTQMMLLSMQAFCGPAMSDAIQGKILASADATACVGNNVSLTHVDV